MRRKKTRSTKKHAYSHLRTLQRAKRNFSTWWTRKFGKKFKKKPAQKLTAMKRYWSRLSLERKLAFAKKRRRKKGGGWWPPPPKMIVRVRMRADGSTYGVADFPTDKERAHMYPEPLSLHGETASAAHARPHSRVVYGPTRATKERYEELLRKKAIERAERERIRVRVSGDPQEWYILVFDRKGAYSSFYTVKGDKAKALKKARQLRAQWSKVEVTKHYPGRHTRTKGRWDRYVAKHKRGAKKWGA